MAQQTFFPGEVVGRMPYITLIGRETLRIEQHQGLIVFRQDEMVFRSAAGDVSVRGRDLRIARYTSDEAEICGCIDGVQTGRGGDGA